MEARRRLAVSWRLIAHAADTIAERRVGAQGRQQFGNVGRIVLAIAVQGDDDLALGGQHAAADAAALAQIAAMAQHPQLGDFAAQRRQRRCRAVGRAVIDKDDFMAPADSALSAAAISRARGATLSASSLTGTTTDTASVMKGIVLFLRRRFTARLGGLIQARAPQKQTDDRAPNGQPDRQHTAPDVAPLPAPPRLLTRLARHGYGVLALVCVLLWLPGVLSLPALDRDESRFAESSRQMLDSGNYVDIRFGQVPRYKKPVGIYWLQAAATAAAGPPQRQISAITRHIWTYRLPSLLGGIAAVWLTFWCGSLFGAEAGLLAGLLMAASMLLTAEASMATTDAVLLAAIMLHPGRAAAGLARGEGRCAAAPSGRLVLAGWAAHGGGHSGQGSGRPRRRGGHGDHADRLALAGASHACQWQDGFPLAGQSEAPDRVVADRVGYGALAGGDFAGKPWRLPAAIAGGLSDLVPNTADYENLPLVTANGFREYDARWLFGKEINLLGIQALGLGLGTYLHDIGVQPKVVTGHDFRSYSLSIKQALTIGSDARGLRGA